MNITSNDRTINGTAQADIIKGGARKQTINGGAGDDFIEGWGNFDTLKGGAGDDTIIGVGFMNGGSGDDFLVGEIYSDFDLRFRDIMVGGAGNDTFVATYRNVTVDAGSGNDDVVIGNVNYDISTGSGNDYVNAGKGDGTINVDGSGYKDIIAGEGNHRLNITHGNVFAELNQELVRVGDSWYNQQTAGDDTVTIGAYAGWTTILTGLGDDVFKVAARNTSNNTLLAGDGDDKITDGAGNSYLYGGEGDDVIKGGAGNDSLNGGSGHDRLNGGDGNDWIDVNGGDIAWGDSGADRFYVSGEGWGSRTIVLKDFRANQGDVLDVSSLYAFNNAMATFNNGKLAFATDTGLITIEGSGIRNDAQFVAAKQNGSLVTDMDPNGGKG